VLKSDVAALELYTFLSRPFFSAVSNADQTKSGTASDVKVLFQTELADNRARYSAGTTSRFTALSGGLHQFSFSLATHTTTTGPEINIRKNNVNLFVNLAIGYGGSYATFGTTFIAYLNAGDYIEVFMRNNNNTTVTLSSGRCHFSGYYIG
jgi:hypothetical protein